MAAVFSHESATLLPTWGVVGPLCPAPRLRSAFAAQLFPFFFFCLPLLIALFPVEGVLDLSSRLRPRGEKDRKPLAVLGGGAQLVLYGLKYIISLSQSPKLRCTLFRQVGQCTNAHFPGAYLALNGG